MMHSRAVVATEPIESPLKSPFPVQYTKLFINNDFVDSASGNFRNGNLIAHLDLLPVQRILG